MTDLYSVVQFFPNNMWERAMHEVPAEDALRHATHLATSVGAKIGTTRRVIITDAGDDTIWQWDYGKGLVWPEVAEVPEPLKAHGPQEFDCAECGMHIVDYSGIERTQCAACIHVPGWYNHADVARILDPDHHRTRGT